jgi:hypothetical protein
VVSTSDTEKAFAQAMTQVYHRAKEEVGYTATRFAQMLGEHGGLRTAKMLLHSPTVSDGFTALWEARRLDLTVEFQVLRPEFGPLFDDNELETARRRLIDYGMSSEALEAQTSREKVSQPARDEHAEIVRLMDGVADDLGLRINETHASRKYRLGTRGPSGWIQPRQGKLYLDFRTFRTADPEREAGDLHTALQRFSSEPVNRDMAGIRFGDALARWPDLERDVVRPFFTPDADLHAAKPAASARPRPASAIPSSTAGAEVGEPIVDRREEAPETVLLEISRRRNAIEERLRHVLSDGLRYAHGDKAAAALVGCLAESRRNVLVGRSYPEMWQMLYLNELRDVLAKEWPAFSRFFGEDKEKVLTWLEHVNRTRVDAHAKAISEEDLAYLRVCFRRLEEALDL